MINKIKVNTTMDVYVLNSHPSVVWIHKEDIEKFIERCVDTSTIEYKKYYEKVKLRADSAQSGVRLRFTGNFKADSVNVFRTTWVPETGVVEFDLSPRQYSKVTLTLTSTGLDDLATHIRKLYD